MNEITLSAWSERRLAHYHHARRERIHRALFPFMVAALIGVTVWALQVLPI